MIKKLQSLKKKKGFTLVELIVVIAIIGVLAAILVPTMLGYVTSSRVTSVNSTAASIQKNVNTFLTDADTSGYGMKQSNNAVASMDINIVNGSWQPSLANGINNPFKTGSTISWGGGVSNVSPNVSKTGIKDAETLLAIELANLFPSLKNGSIHIEMKAGTCTAVAYTEDQSSSIATTDMPGITSGEFSAAFSWDGKTAGVAPSGILVGTSPAVPLG